MVAGVFDVDDATGTIRSAKIAVGACSAVAQRLSVLEAELVGTRPGAVSISDEHLAHLSPLDDVRGSAAYRRAAARQLVADMLAGLSQVKSS
jgi:CO/xanthine dehydrogenase FAD-binding subunit